MANNRLLLECVICHENIPIARLQVGMDEIWLPSRTAVLEYEQWLLRHSTCGHRGLEVALRGENDWFLTIHPSPDPP